MPRGRPAGRGRECLERRGDVRGPEHAGAGHEACRPRRRRTGARLGVDAAVDLHAARRRRPCRGTAAILSSWSGMNACPPKPGSTVITSTRSTARRSGRMALPVVPGLERPRPPPASVPAAGRSAACGSLSASMWKVMLSAPASANGSTKYAGSVTIRCTSSRRSVSAPDALNDAGPKRQVRHEVPVHHVHVQQSRAGRARRRRSARPAAESRTPAATANLHARLEHGPGISCR